MSLATRTRPITIAILAMGGEGGGVLSDWLVALGEANAWFAQSTSVPGVAQRTGATIYYVEMFPRDLEHPHRYPVLSTMPTPGEVDVVVASELMEAGRAIQRGLVTPQRTVLISSTSRSYAMPERTAMADGRIDSAQIIDAAKAASLRFVRGDFAKIADDTRSVISAVLFGAIAAAAVLPFSREQFEAAIAQGGKGVEASLRAFGEGFRVAAASERPTVDIQIGMRPVDPAEAQLAADKAMAASNPQGLVGSKLQTQAERIAHQFPTVAAWMLVNGIKRCAQYQDVAYADQYLDRVARVATVDDGRDDFALTTAAAQHVAVAMTYEDTIRVAFHKTRERRFDRIEGEVRIGDGQMLEVRDYLHPQVEEIADTLPTGLGRWVLQSRAMNALIHKVTHKGLKLNTSSVTGYSMLYITARLRPLRRRSLRFSIEQQRIDSWLDTVVRGCATGGAFAEQVVLLQSLVRGYGSTHANGVANYQAILAVIDQVASGTNPAGELQRLRTAALADESGTALRAALTSLPA